MTIAQNNTIIDKFEWLKYHLKFLNRKIILAIFKKNLKVNYGKNLISIEEGNEWLYQSITGGKPFAVGKFGCIEISAISEVVKDELGLGSMDTEDINNLYINAGFFPIDKVNVKKFAELYLSIIGDINILGTWNTRFEDYLVRKYMKETMLCSLEFLEPYYFQKPWTKSLEGKKVLVIHPFAESISSQYEKRELLFENKDVLPKFELITIKAVQTIAGTKSEFNTWFDALNFMYEKAMAIDFDVAIIGCGAYGLPLTVKFKQAGKQAVHLGGATQILFGIKGGRWDQNPMFINMYNEHWVRPNENETPKDSNKVEGACYW